MTQGYVVIQPVDIPIVGPTGKMNDHYIDELREDLDLTLEAVEKAGYLDRDRVGIGGHSYGAFSTVNAMTHTPYFKAGIAGDGMYNRTLTPFNFQSERRTFWEAQDTYLDMSPFLAADRLSGALLMYHSLEDQNVGTDPISSDPHDAGAAGPGQAGGAVHVSVRGSRPATRETDLDQWARWLAWFDIYVKNPQKKDRRRPRSCRKRLRAHATARRFRSAGRCIWTSASSSSMVVLIPHTTDPRLPNGMARSVPRGGQRITNTSESYPMDRGIDFLKSQVNNATMQHQTFLDNLQQHESQADDERFRSLYATFVPKARAHQEMLEQYQHELGTKAGAAKKVLGKALGVARDLVDAPRENDFLRLVGDIVMSRQAEDTFKTFRDAGRTLGDRTAGVDRRDGRAPSR